MAMNHRRANTSRARKEAGLGAMPPFPARMAAAGSPPSRPRRSRLALEPPRKHAYTHVCMSPYHTVFEWDPDKEAINIRKHGIDFAAAAEILGDPLYEFHHVEEYQFVEREERVRTYACHPQQRWRVFAIVWTERYDEGTRVTRIISCRKASGYEKRQYEKTIETRQP